MTTLANVIALAVVICVGYLILKKVYPPVSCC